MAVYFLTGLPTLLVQASTACRLGHNYYVNAWAESFPYSPAHLNYIMRLNQQKGRAGQGGFCLDKLLGHIYISQPQSQLGLGLYESNFNYFSSSLPFINKSKFCPVLVRHANGLQPCQPDTCVSLWLHLHWEVHPPQGTVLAFLPSSTDWLLSAFQKLWRPWVNAGPDLFWVAVALRSCNSFSFFAFSFLFKSEQNCVL